MASGDASHENRQEARLDANAHVNNAIAFVFVLIVFMGRLDALRLRWVAPSCWSGSSFQLQLTSESDSTVTLIKLPFPLERLAF
jgi:hypothetical protein